MKALCHINRISVEKILIDRASNVKTITMPIQRTIYVKGKKHSMKMLQSIFLHHAECITTGKISEFEFHVSFELKSFFLAAKISWTMLRENSKRRKYSTLECQWWKWHGGKKTDAVVEYVMRTERTFIFIVCTMTTTIAQTTYFLIFFGFFLFFVALDFLRIRSDSHTFQNIVFNCKEFHGCDKRIIRHENANKNMSQFHEVRSCFLTLQWQIIIWDKKQSCNERKNREWERVRKKREHLNIFL